MVKSIFFRVFLFFILITQLYADISINSVTFNGVGSVTVGANEAISTNVNVTTTGNGANNDWLSTKWTINGNETCVAGHNFTSANTHNTTFDIYSPASSGTYDAIFKVYSKNNCQESGGRSDTVTLNNVISVETTCTNYQLNLLHKTYDLSTRIQYIDDNAEFETVLSTFQNKEIGRGFIENINGDTNPFSSQQDDYLSQFTGFIDITSTGTYTFAVDGDDAVELLIDDVVVTSWYGAHGPCNCTTHTGDINLTVGKHKIEFRHHERNGGASYKLHWKKPGYSTFEIIPSGNLFHCAPKKPIAEYRFNECTWSGIDNEVKDSSASFNGTSTNAVTTSSEKILSRSADFSANTNSDYVKLDPEILNGKSDFSVALWIKGNSIEDQALVSAAQSSQNNEAIMFFTNSGTVFSPHIKGTRTQINIPDVTDNFWHHLVWQRDGTSGENCLVIDGNTTNKYCGNNSKIGTLSVEGLIVAQEQDSVNGSFVQGQDFEGYMDELKFYDVIISDNDINEIYNNEKNGYTYEGLQSEDIFCSAGICSNYSEKLNIATYDVSSFTDASIDSNTEFNTVIATYVNYAYKFGSGLTAQINATGSNNNPYGSDETYLSVIDGYLYIPSEGNYTFMVNGDDAVEVLIDGVVVSSWYSNHAPSSDPANDTRIQKLTANLKQGYHEIQFHHHENTGGDNYQLYWKQPGDISYQIIPSSNFFHCLPYPPLFEYRFDECNDYNGTVNEVIDSSGNDHHGTTNGNMSLYEDGIMNSGVEFGLESDVNDINAIISAQSPTQIGSKGAISFWYKSKKNWNSSDGVMLVDATKGNKYFFLGLESNGKLKLWAEDSNDRDFQSQSNNTFTFSSSEWVHITMSWDYTQKRFKLYVNGVEESLNKTPPFTGVMPDLKPIHIGDISENYTQNTSVYNGVRNSANGYFDEFRAYQGELKAYDVKNIYDNEKAGKNFDGSLRGKPLCLTIEQCYADTFNRSELGDTWTIINKVGYTPIISNNKMSLTNLSGNVATAIMLSGEFPSANNYVEIEFEHNAYGGSGADGMTITLADASVIKPLLDANLSDIAGAYGGSLGYAQRTGVEGFKGGWLGLGLDEYGNFSNPVHGAPGGPGVVRDSVSIRGHGIKSGSGLWDTGYEYLSGTSTLTPEVDKTPQPNGYMYKFSVDTRDINVTMIKVQRDVGSGYETIIDWFDASQNAVSPENFKLSITASTGGATNIHSVDNIIIRATGCGTLGEVEEILSSFFDAWDINKDILQRDIITKKVNSSFDLSIASLNDTNDALLDYNGSVCARVVDDISNNSLSDWKELQFNSDNKLNANFSVVKANKEARVEIVWKNDVTEACPLVNETNSTRSTDNFAIRPDKFDFTLPALAYASETFNVDFEAGSAADYNETFNSSFTVEANISKSECDNGILNVTPFSFANGAKSVDVNYSDVGDINITIKEILGSEFALVDIDDTTNEIDRLISPYTQVLTVKPYELNVTNVQYSNTIGSDWLYMTDVESLSQNVKSTIVANDKLHNQVQNFTNDCYAEDVHVDTNFNFTNLNNNVEIKYNDGTIVNIEDINKTIVIPRTAFTTSQADIDYDFNVQRDYKTPYNPIQIDLNEVNIISTGLSKIVNNAAIDMNSTFYYARVKTKDISTNEQSISHYIDVEIYSTNPLFTFTQNSLNWYQNENDTFTSGIVFNEKENFTFTNDKNDMNVTNIQNVNQGKINFELVNSWDKSDSSMIHLDIPAWLWYSQYNPYDPLADCSTHPCFEYSYIKAGSNSGIESGTFNGSSIGKDYNATKEKIGVKTFR